MSRPATRRKPSNPPRGGRLLDEHAIDLPNLRRHPTLLSHRQVVVPALEWNQAHPALPQKAKVIPTEARIPFFKSNWTVRPPTEWVMSLRIKYCAPTNA